MEKLFTSKDQILYSFSFANKGEGIFWVTVSKIENNGVYVTSGTRVIRSNHFDWGSSDWISSDVRDFIERTFKLKAFL